MSRSGRAVVLDGVNGNFSIAELIVPERVGPGEMLVRQELCGVCGTDLHVYKGHMSGLKFPVILGHELVGRIEILGEGITHDYVGRPVAVGDRIIVKPGVPCGKCYYCAVLYMPTRCRSSLGYGLATVPEEGPRFNGGYADYLHVNIPGTVFFKTEMPAERAVLTEPFCVGVHIADEAEIKLGETVVIQGSGPIGLAATMAAKMSGAVKTILVGGPARRLDLARELGADVTIDIFEAKDPQERIRRVLDETLGRYGADVVIEAVGLPLAMLEGVGYLRDGGTYVEAGHFTDTGEVSINPNRDLARKAIRLRGSWGAGNEHFLRGIGLLEAGKAPVERLLSHQLPLERAAEAMEALSGKYEIDGRSAMKIAMASRAA